MIIDEQCRYREVVAINRAIASAEAYGDILRLVVERTAAFTDATACMLLLRQSDGLARIVRSYGIDPENAARVAVPLTELVVQELCVKVGFPSADLFVGVPVIGKEGLLGILAVYGEGAVESTRHDELLSALADQAAIALDNAERVRRLVASEKKLAAVISVAADAIIFVDESQTIRMFNDGAEKIFGWSRDEILGSPLGRLLPERFRTIHGQHVQNFGTGRDAARKMAEDRPSIVGLRKNGEEFPADAAISRVLDGAAWLYAVVLRDITEQKRVEHEQRFLADVGPILATSLDYDETVRSIAELAVRELADLCIVDEMREDGEIHRRRVVCRDASRVGVCELLMGVSLDRRRPHLMTSALERRCTVLLQNPSSDEIASLAQNDDHLRALRAADIRSMVTAPLIVHGTVLGAIAFISSTHEYAACDVRLAEELAQRAALAIESARLYGLAARAVRSRDDVLGVVAHDLRSPLFGILVQVALLRLRGAESGPLQTHVDSIECSATRMKRMVEDLLDVARMEAGQLSVELARVPAGQLVADSLAAHQSLAASFSIELRLEVDAELGDVWGDRDRLLQVFENLIGNALKFTESGGRITVSAAPREDCVQFSVSDTGSGISSENIPRLFDPFWQAQKTGRRGAGLGLSIVQGVIDAHHGRLWVESTLGVGSTFYFCIPAKPPVEAIVQDSATSEKRIGGALPRTGASV
ncbi:MAG: ATP-binding protein [Candidatus Binatia bacterium]